MKLKIILWSALATGSVLGVFIAGAAIFAGAYFLDGVTNETQRVIDMELIEEALGLLAAFLIVVAVVIAWFNHRLGGILIFAFSILHILFGYEPEIAWLQIAILPVGPLLLLYVYYNKRLLTR